MAWVNYSKTWSFDENGEYVSISMSSTVIENGNDDKDGKNWITEWLEKLREKKEQRQLAEEKLVEKRQEKGRLEDLIEKRRVAAQAYNSADGIVSVISDADRQTFETSM